jgi:TIR domain
LRGAGAISNTVFISYRSADDAYAAALLDVMLSRSFGQENVFRASRSIPPGGDYSKFLTDGIDSSKVMLAVIGRTWLEKTIKGLGDLNRPRDWVREEIARAFEKEIPVIPILLSGTPRLTDADLPPEISQLSSIQYIRFEYRSIESDFAQIRSTVSRYIPLRASERREDCVARALMDLSEDIRQLRSRLAPE